MFYFQKGTRYRGKKIRKEGVSNGLCEHLRACEQCVYFASTSSCHIFLASSEHFEYFVNFPLAGISLLLIGLMFCAK